MAPTFCLHRVSAAYPKQPRLAVQDVSLRIERGETFCLLGENGSGKTTLIRVMMGLTRANRGSVELFGEDIAGPGISVSRTVGYMPQSSSALDHLTVREALYYVSHWRGSSRRDALAQVQELLATCNLGPAGRTEIRRLSGGQRRMAQFALALAARPPVLVLDEPTNDLDPARRRSLWNICRDLTSRSGQTLVLITHDAVEVERAVDRVGIMRQGLLITSGRPHELRAAVGWDLKVEVMGGERPPDRLGCEEWTNTGSGRWTTFLSAGEREAAVNLLRTSHQLFRIESTSLEEILLHYNRVATRALADRSNE